MELDDEHRGTFGTSDTAIELIEDLQFTLGEGPCIDTYRTGVPVLEPDLGHPAENRWHGFTGPALAAGVGAIFGFPLVVGTMRLGALDLSTDRRGDLRPEQFADALRWQTSRRMPSWSSSPTPRRVRSRVRAHAFAAGRPIHDVAQDVVRRNLRLD